MGLAALPWDRRETYEAGGLGVVDDARVRASRRGARLRSSRRRLECSSRCQALARVRICVAQGFEASVNRFDLAVNLPQPLSKLAF